MSQCFLNAPIQSVQRGCRGQTRTAYGANSFRHAKLQAISSSKASRSSSFAGRSLHAKYSYKVARQQHPLADAVTCQAAAEKMVIAVTGATGLVGSRLVSRLSAQGHTVRVLTRNPDKARGKLPYARLRFYNIQQQLQEALQGATGVVNLAGEPIATRWSASLKREIKASRVTTTTNLAEAINGLPEADRPQVLCSASAVGYYGNSQNQTFNESSNSGGDYLAEVCRDWEAAAEQAKTKRVVIMRTGIVLAKEGGALAKMLPIFNIFAGGPLGNGQQWCSWVHRDDLVNLYIEALQNSAFNGTYNATAPNPVRMSELCSSLGRVLGRPSWLPVPEFALQSVLGEGASVVLEGQKVISSRTQDAGFTFRYKSLQDALLNFQ
ncbi:hypothetical protein ABBQ32_004213 [Trebouxia sp. C0010 RCD-2024]